MKKYPTGMFYEELIGMSIITGGLAFLIYKILDGRPLSELPRLRDLEPKEKTL